MGKFTKGLLSVVVALAMVIGVMPTVEVNAATPTESLQAALTASGTVTLTENVTLTEGLEIPSGVEVTLDLKGNTITFSDTVGTATNALITNNGTLTIMDSDVNGKLTYNSVSTSTGYSTSTIINNGVLTIESGTVENTSTDGASYAIDNYNTLNMNGGTVVAKKTSIRQAQFGNYDNIVNISGGVIGSDDSSAGLQIHGFSNSKNTSTTITGATFKGTYAFYSYFYEITNTSNTNINVSNGTFDGYVYLYNHNAGSNEHPFNAEITGGTYNSGAWVYTSDSDSNMVSSKVVSGGNFPNGLDEEYIVDGFEIDNDGNVDFENRHNVTNEADLLTLISLGGEITLTGNVTLNSIVVIEKDVTINGNGNTITSSADKSFRIFNNDTSVDDNVEVTFNNVIIENTASYGRCIDTRTDNVTVNINNSTLKTTGSGNTQPITIGGTDTGLTTINLNNSSVNAGTSGYAVISFVKTDLNINNSELQGYSVIYLQDNADNSTVDIINSSVSYSENVHSGESNAFATVVLQDVDNVSLNIKDSTVSAIQTGDQPQSVINIQTLNEAGTDYVPTTIGNNIVTVTGNSSITLEGEGVFVNSTSTAAELKENVTVSSTVSVSSNLRNEVSRFVPEEPKSTVEFIVDGKVWRTYRVTKGADIRMPEVPEKDGYVGEWDHDGENIRTATTITAVYTKVEEPVNNTDLSDYADFQLPVYANSRVTNIATANGTITVEGYMFKANANLDKEDSIWREIIFVNEEDYSMAKAYRKQVTPVYNTWLNKNMTATGNGTYALDYANYTVNFSNTDINNYVGNTPATKMASGSYLAYMRISDGTDSYLFPLKDIVLSDGSTLALPSGFEVVDTTTRALRYIVK